MTGGGGDQLSSEGRGEVASYVLLYISEGVKLTELIDADDRRCVVCICRG
jgi:hypothetical protein